MIAADTRFAVADLYADYCAHLDARRYYDWLALFDTNCSYIVQPRENHDRGLPLATMRLTSHAMLRDRIEGVVSTIYHAPYYQRHVVAAPRLSLHDGTLHAEANFVVVRTHLDQPSEVFAAGRYLDTLIETAVGWRLRAKRVVFDSELVPNSIIYPL